MTTSPAPLQLATEAKAAYQTEEYHLAAQKFAAAEAAYQQSGDALMAAEMANNRSVALLKGGSAEAAYQAAHGTADIFARAGDLRRQAIALSNQAAALEVLKKYDEALNLYRQAADLLKTAGDDEMRAYVLKNISLIQFRHQDRFAALASMRIALENQKHLSLRDRILKWLLGIVFRMLGGR